MQRVVSTRTAGEFGSSFRTSIIVAAVARLPGVLAYGELAYFGLRLTQDPTWSGSFTSPTFVVSIWACSPNRCGTRSGIMP